MVTVHYRRWCPPKSPLRIEFRPELLHAVRLEGCRISTSIPAQWTPPFKRTLNQSSGLLFGVRYQDEVRVLAVRGDEKDVAPEGLAPLGTFVCRARGEVFLTDDDLANFEKHRGVLALVVAGGQAGFFVRERDGSVQAIRSHEEFQVAAVTPQRAPVREAAAELPAPAPHWWPAWKRLAACAGLLAIPAGAFAVRPLLPHLPIALAMHEEAGQLVIGWNAGTLMDGSRLEIRDGSERTVLLLPAHTSSATYGPKGSDVQVRLTSDTRVGGAHWEAARFIPRPSRRPPPSFGAVRDRITALSREARTLRRSLVKRQARTGELMARMDELTATPGR
jgi:hypothetical protein